MKQVCRVGKILVGINCIWTLFFYTWNFCCIDGSLSFNITSCPNNSGPLKKLWETLRLQIFTYWSRSRYFCSNFIVVQSVNGYNVLSCSWSSLLLCHCQHCHHWMLCRETSRFRFCWVWISRRCRSCYWQSGKLFSCIILLNYLWKALLAYICCYMLITYHHSLSSVIWFKIVSEWKLCCLFSDMILCSVLSRHWLSSKKQDNLTLELNYHRLWIPKSRW